MKKDNKYAVVLLGGKQYRVFEGQEVLVDKLDKENKLEVPVLLYVDGDKVKVGKPHLKDVKVSFDVLSEVEKGEKVKVFKYKSKSRFRKRMGFRAKLTRLQVKKISS